MNHQERTIAWLSLWRVSGVGPKQFRAVLDSCGSIEALFQTSPADWQRLGFKAAQSAELSALCQAGECRLTAPVEGDLRWLQIPNNHLLTWQDDNYPDLLREIDSAPPLLFVSGQMGALSLPQIAMVGTRQPSRQGRADAFEFARHFARQGFVTTSGMALGIDAAAHDGAIEGGGLTIGVMAHGLDQIYPLRNRDLGLRVRQQGALVSEFPTGVKPLPAHFPRRNRIISGLSMAVLVIEAALQSGSLITAREAIKQGRDVFALPGSIHNPLSKGCHQLIRQGAQLVETGQDITQELRPMLTYYRALADAPLATSDAAQDRSPARSATLFPPDSVAAQLLALLSWEPLSVDGLVMQSGLSVADINANLVMLELHGSVIAELDGYRLASVSELS